MNVLMQGWDSLTGPPRAPVRAVHYFNKHITQVINAPYNELGENDIPKEVFSMEDITTLDFSHNKLQTVPPHLPDATGLVVLNLSHNAVSEVPERLFTQVCVFCVHSSNPAATTRAPCR